jgi:two-component system, NtrC family, sensor kinase
MSGPNGLSERILILGDEAKSARSIQRLLAAAGYDAISAPSFESAQQELAARDISIIIIETSASRLTDTFLLAADDDSVESLRRLHWAHLALNFCEEVRAAETTADVPILVISKSHRAQDKVVCLNQGATDYITRPYQRAELLSRVRAHLRSSRYERERNERFEQLNVLHTVSSVLASSLEPEVLMQGTLTAIMKYVRACSGVVFLREADERPMTVAAAEGLFLTDAAHVSLLELYARIVPLMNGKPLVLEPLPESARRALVADSFGDVQGLACTQLVSKGKTLGAVCLFSRVGTPLLKHKTELLSTICNQLTIALENARFYLETKKSAAQLSFVYNLGHNLMTSLEMDELLSYAVFTVGKSLECDACAVIVRSSIDSTDLASAICSRSHGIQPEGNDWFHKERVVSYLTSADWRVQPAIQIRTAERFLHDPNVLLETVVPLMFDDRMLGILICGSFVPRPISPDDQKLLGAVAQQLSLAIRNTELYRRTKDTSINLAVEVSQRTREAEEQKRFTEKIIDSLPVSLYVVDRDMRIVAWNRNREVGGLGINREQVLGRNVFQVLVRQPRRKLEEEFVDVFRSGEIVHMEQESVFDGQRKTWKISKIPMRVDNAEVSHVITVGEDITEQKKMNEAVIHAEKLASIGRLAAGVVHEINNPLATIAACSEALTARVEDLEEADLHQDFGEYLQIIKDEAFRCKTITNSLLEFSHQRQAEKLAGDINQIIEQTLQLIKHHPKLGKMRVIKELDPSLEPVYVNEGQMKQVFIALMSNSFDAMEDDGVLTIRTHWSDSDNAHSVCVEISDTGSGIPAAHLAKIFDPFFTTKPLGRGTGLGLSVCYGIVSEHGGRIEVDSTEGVGTTFRLLLPPYQELGAAAREQSFEGILEMEGVL